MSIRRGPGPAAIWLLALGVLAIGGGAVPALAEGPRVAAESRLERDGARLEVREGRLVRVAGADVAELEALGGPEADVVMGWVWDLAPDPSGLTYVAAERGVFVVAPGVTTVAEVVRQEGAPSGAPRSVAMDGRRRLWIATEKGVGVIDVNLGWGLCLPPSELPGPGPFRLRTEGEDLVVQGASGEKRWSGLGDPAAEGAFDWLEVRVNGTPLDRAAAAPPSLELALGDVPIIQASASTGAAGPGAAGKGARATKWIARYRVNGHHWLRSLDDDEALCDLAPGRHRLEIFGYDGLLRRSRPWAVELLVRAPFYYRKSFLVGAVGVLGAGILLLFTLRARRRGTPPARVLASSAILGTICLQVAAGIWPHAKGWPFVGYSMYSEPFDPTGYVHEALLHFQDDRGRLHSRSAYSMGLAIDNPWQVLHPLIYDNGPAVDRMWSIMPTLFPGKRITSFQVVSERTKLTTKGPAQVPHLVLAHFEREGVR